MPFTSFLSPSEWRARLTSLRHSHEMHRDDAQANAAAEDHAGDDSHARHLHASQPYGEDVSAAMRSCESQNRNQSPLSSHNSYANDGERRPLLSGSTVSSWPSYSACAGATTMGGPLNNADHGKGKDGNTDYRYYGGCDDGGPDEKQQLPYPARSSSSSSSSLGLPLSRHTTHAHPHSHTSSAARHTTTCSRYSSDGGGGCPSCSSRNDLPLPPPAPPFTSTSTLLRSPHTTTNTRTKHIVQRHHLFIALSLVICLSFPVVFLFHQSQHSLAPSIVMHYFSDRLAHWVQMLLTLMTASATAVSFTPLQAPSYPLAVKNPYVSSKLSSSCYCCCRASLSLSSSSPLSITVLYCPCRMPDFPVPD